MRIAVDMDDILADFMSNLCAYLKDRQGIVLAREQWRTYKLHEIVGISREDGITMITDFHESPYFCDMVPVAGAQEGIAALRRHHELILVTARHDGMDGETRRFLAEHFGDAFAGLHYTNFARHDGSEVSKAGICQREGAELLIDDNLKHALGCAAVGIPSLLLTAPWNQEAELPTLVARVSSWGDIVERLTPR